MDYLIAMLVGAGIGVLAVFDAWASARYNRRLADPRLRHPELTTQPNTRTKNSGVCIFTAVQFIPFLLG